MISKYGQEYIPQIFAAADDSQAIALLRKFSKSEMILMLIDLRETMDLIFSMFGIDETQAQQYSADFSLQPKPNLIS